MGRALILLGQKSVNQKTIESYQLLIGEKYLSTNYDPSWERTQFFEKVSDTFVRRVLEQNQDMELLFCNGIVINHQTGEHEEVQKLEDRHSAQFTEKLNSRLIERKDGGLLPPSAN